MKRLLIIVVILLALLAGSVLAGWWWLTTTRSGAEWALNRAAGFTETLSWQELRGGLAGGLELRGVELIEADTRINVDRLELAARISVLRGLGVDIHWVRAFDVDIHLPETEPPDPDAPAFEMPDISSPIPITVRELVIDNLRLIPAEPDSEPIVVERLHLTGQYHQRLDLETLTLTLAESELSASGHWQLQAPFGGDLRIEGRHNVDASVQQHFQARLHGRLAALEAEISATGPVTTEGQIRLRGLPNDMEVSLNLSGSFAEWPELELSAHDLDIRASGNPNAWQARVSGRLEGMDLPDNHLLAELEGSTTEVKISQLLVDVFDGRVEASGRVGFNPELQTELIIHLTELDLTELYPDWPRQARINGRLDLEADPRTVKLHSLELSAPPTALAVSGSGSFEPERDYLALNLDWQDFNWPPIADDSEPLFASRSGRMSISGSISDWQLELETFIRALDQPEARVESRANGDDQQANIEFLDINAGDLGRLRASGRVFTEPALSGQFNLELVDADPGYFVAQLPGKISSTMTLAFQSTADMTVEIQSIDGSLRGQPLTGSGRVAVSEEQPEAGRLDLAWGDNRLNVDSDDGQTWEWELRAASMDQLWPEIAGQLELDGQYDSVAQRLVLSGLLADASVADFQLKRGEINADLSWQETARAKVGLVLNELDLNPWERIEQLEFSLDGSCNRHVFRLNLGSQRGTLDVTGNGNLPDCLTGNRDWQGSLERLYLAETLAGDWELNHPLRIQASPDEVSAEAACLVESVTRQGRLCLRSLLVDGNSRIDVGIEQVPMDLLLIAIDPTFHLTTPLSGEITARWSTTAGLETLSGHLELGAGALTPLDNGLELLIIESVRLDLIPEGDQLVLLIEALLEGDSHLRGQARLDDLNEPATAQIEAEARLNLPDIGIFNRLVTELDQLGGKLEADLQINGPLTGPAMVGHLRISEGLVVHAPLGLKVTDIEIDVDGDNDQGRISGRMLSGEGHLSINGQIRQAADQLAYELNIEGERFSFADIDWLSIAASPSIRLNGRGDQIELDGDIHIRRLRAGMPPGSEERVTASADVRVIGETEEQEEMVGEQKLRGRLGIHLGDDARLAAMGMQTSLAGGIELLWEPPNLQPRGRGIVHLPQGSYRAYGQNLEIRDGEVLFTGHPLDNPRLDIKATRDIFGDPQVDEAGVHIRGNAQAPVIELFTDPPTSEEKALAYVVTGADFDHAGGRAAVNVGFYLLPRLFVSYGIGLFEAGNVLSGRYELSRRWGVRVVSGERDTGVDLSFAIDR
jgi:translocation and assembly module TamB